jgi:light-regulated signal transduction histidine kinase (bacteriophytochrome)
MTQDITLRKELEIELGNYNQKLQSEIKNRTTELTIANQNLDAFNYSISHDLKTPIRGLEIYTELLKETLNHNDESLEYLEHLQNGIDEIKTMISALLNFSKYATVELNKQSIDMQIKIEQSIQSSLEHRKPNTRFVIGDTPPLYMDASLIPRVLDNLLSNAIKYSSKKSEPLIEISGTSDGAFTTYTIRDNGDGFDEKLAYKLFKPFSRLHNDSEFEGSGAGLAIVERIISRHHGKIWAESKKGEGAVFYFKIPDN